MGNQLSVYADPDRCILCWACQVACKQWHGFKAGDISRRWVVEESEGTFPDVKRVFFSESCRHCEKPDCLDVCPAGAISKREEDGIVVVDQELCIGCQSCAGACPHGVPQYEIETGKMNKCDLCLSLGVGEDGRPTPRCVQTCPTQALYFGTDEEIQVILDEKEAIKAAAAAAK